MKGYYYVEWNKNHVRQTPRRCHTFEEAREAARELLAAQVPDIDQYTTPIRKGINTNYRNAVADFVEGFFKDADFFKKEYRFSFYDDPEAYMKENDGEEDALEDIAVGEDYGRCLWLGSHGGFELISRHWLQNTDEDDFLELKCNDMLIGVSVHYKAGLLVEEKQDLHNIFLVWSALDANEFGFQTVDEICETIKAESFVELSSNTVRAQIENLKKLGFAVEEVEELYTPNGFSHQQTRVRYRLKDDACGEAQKGGYAKSAYPMMTYLVLLESETPLSQQAILDAIFERFGVKMQRQTVGKHVKLLQEMGCEIAYNICRKHKEG